MAETKQVQPHATDENGVEDMDCKSCLNSSTQQGQTTAGENRYNHTLVHPAVQTEPSSRKRGREEEGLSAAVVDGGATRVEKRGCEEGMSWWTCLMLGMDQENTQPQVVKKVYDNYR